MMWILEIVPVGWWKTELLMDCFCAGMNHLNQMKDRNYWISDLKSPVEEKTRQVYKLCFDLIKKDLNQDPSI